MKKVVKIVLSIIVVISLVVIIGLSAMKKKADEAMKNQINVEIDMSKVEDGTYEGTSDGGMVKVEVKVEVKDHKITNIELVKHENGKGKPAESMIDDMVKENTYDVDCVSGATLSSKTIKNAVNKALQKGLTN